MIFCKLFLNSMKILLDTQGNCFLVILVPRKDVLRFMRYNEKTPNHPKSHSVILSSKSLLRPLLCSVLGQFLSMFFFIIVIVIQVYILPIAGRRSPLRMSGLLPQFLYGSSAGWEVHTLHFDFHTMNTKIIFILTLLKKKRHCWLRGIAVMILIFYLLIFFYRAQFQWG